MNNKKKNKFNPKNERAKYQYRKHLRRVNSRDEKTIIAALEHIRSFELYLNFEGFQKYNSHVADKYIQNMFAVGFSLSYITDNIRYLKDFLRWLERQHGYRSKIDYNQIDYLNISRNQRITAKAVEYQKAYKFDEIIKTIRHMPNETDKDKQDRAIISLQALCALRISELRTVKMKSLIQEDGIYFIYVCPKNMNVKFAKTRQATFMPLPADIIANVIEWKDYLLSLGFKDTDPLFPKVDNHFTETNLLEQTIRKEEIKSDTTIRNVFKLAFESAGFEYIKPHNFRKTHVRYAECQSPAFLNAVRQSLGHSSIDTTLNSYGQQSHAEQRRYISEVRFSLADL